MTPQKIIIFGFPHCGTSILKSIIGHIDDVEEIYYETDSIDEEDMKTTKKYILCKYPQTKEEYFYNQSYDQYIKIFIIRNPLFVFSSMNKRFNYKINIDHGLIKYSKVIEQFAYYKKYKQPNLYLIRYEDLFDDNFQKFKNILDDIGFIYTDQIFNNDHYENKIFSHILEIPIEKPSHDKFAKYRTWQINQPFKNNNDQSKLDLKDEQIEFIKNINSIDQIYPNLSKDIDQLSK